MKLLYREVNFEELEKLGDIDRKQKISKKYIHHKDQLKLEEVDILVTGWDPDELDLYIKRLKDIKKHEGFIYGAFSHHTNLVGLIALDKRFLDEEAKFINLDMLYVSSEFRNMGIGKTLVKKSIKEAKKTRAQYLYISSSDFKETVDFYFNLGAELTKPIKSMYEKEPEDIHMSIKID